MGASRLVPLVVSPTMWMTRDTALSDVVLAPAGLVVGAGVVSLLARLPFWPGGIPGVAILVVAAIAIMIVWPTWLARQRDESSVVGQPLRPGDIVTGLVPALPLILGGISLGLVGGGSPTSAATLVRRFVLVTTGVGGMLQVVLWLVTATGSFLVVTLVARRAPSAFMGPDMPASGALRTFGLALAGIATILWMLVSIAGPDPVSVAPIMGLAVAVMVVLVDRLLPAGMTMTRTAALAPGVVALVLWLFSGGLLLGQGLLDNLASGSVAAAVAIAMGLLVNADRPWAALALPFASSMWLVVSVLPVLA